MKRVRVYEIVQKLFMYYLSTMNGLYVVVQKHGSVSERKYLVMTLTLMFYGLDNALLNHGNLGILEVTRNHPECIDLKEAIHPVPSE